MKIGHLFLVNAIVSTSYGLAFVLVPATALALYGVSQGPGEILMGRFFGGSLLSTALIAWFARNSGESEARRAIALGFFISYVVSLIVSIHGTVSGLMNAFGWSAVLIYLFFILGYGYFLFFGRETVSTR